VVSIGVFGGFLIMSQMPDDPRKRRDASAHHADNSGPATTRHSWIITKLLEMPFSRPSSFWVPLFSITLTVFYTFCALENHYMAFDNTTEFATACPENDRRTQTSAFVKLFAGTVTTVCIHGHLGSLMGSDSWRRELFRMLEVLVNPLASLFAVADAMWRELAISMQVGQDSWDEKVSIRYMLACMCRVRIDTGSSTPAPRLIGINPHHLSSKALKRNLKWSGRLFLLVVLFAQYVQAAILLSRRLIANTAATVDCAMILMTISGLSALTQSLVISLIKTTWTLTPDSFSPCIARACRLQSCIALKTELNLPTSTFKLTVFGYNIVGIPRAALYVLAGGNLHLLLLLRKNKSLWEIVGTTISVNMCHGILLRILVYVYYYGGWFKEMFRDEKNDTLPRSNEDIASTNRTISEGTPAIEENEALPRKGEDTVWTDGTIPEGAPSIFSRLKYTPLTAILFIIPWTVGLGAIVLALFIVAIQLVYLFSPGVTMYLNVVSETESWNNWDPLTPCPQLWKDGLEDELWWF
jgi:hypothetical protein